MDNEKLNTIKNDTCDDLKKHNFKFETKGKYPAWKPDKNEFTQTVYEVYKKHNPSAQFRAIHAGLECAIFKEKFPQLKIASIGPNIYNPHSYDEKVSISSIDNLFKIVQEIVSLKEAI